MVDSKRADRQFTAKIQLFNTALWTALAIDRLFFHVDKSLGYLTAVIAVGCLSSWFWLIRETRNS